MGDYFFYVEANIACIIIMGIILHNIEKGVDKQISTIILTRMVRLLALYCATDSIWVLFECKVFPGNKIILYIATIVPYFCLVTSSWLWYMYCEIVQKNTSILTHKGTLKSILPFYAAILILIIGIFKDIIFIIDENGYLEYGPLYAVLLCAPIGYLLYSSIKALRRAFTSNRYYDHSLYVAMGIFPLFPIVCGLLQAVFLTVPIMCYGAACAVLFLYITATDNRVSTDPRTQINNRQEMQRYLTQKMKSRPQDGDLYLLILDVDHFKGINDKYGHIEGDKALVTIADALKASCVDRKNRAFISRYGGDEFIVVMEAESEDQVLETANLIRSNITRMNEESGAEFKLSACIGYAKFDYDNPVTIPQLIAQADEKLYEMKKNRE